MLIPRCPCLDLYSCPHFINRMTIEGHKDNALFENKKVYDVLLLQYENLFTAGYDIHGIDKLGFRAGEYVLTPPENAPERPVEPVNTGSPYALPPAPKPPTGTFGIEPHLDELGAMRAGTRVPYIASPIMDEVRQMLRGDVK